MGDISDGRRHHQVGRELRDWLRLIRRTRKRPMECDRCTRPAVYHISSLGSCRTRMKLSTFAADTASPTPHGRSQPGWFHPRSLQAALMDAGRGRITIILVSLAVMAVCIVTLEVRHGLSIAVGTPAGSFSDEGGGGRVRGSATAVRRSLFPRRSTRGRAQLVEHLLCN